MYRFVRTDTVTQYLFWHDMSKQKCAFCQKGYCHAIPVSAKLPQSSDTTEPHREKKLKVFFSVAAPPRKGEPLKPLTLFYKKGSDFLSLPFVFSLLIDCVSLGKEETFFIFCIVLCPCGTWSLLPDRTRQRSRLRGCFWLSRCFPCWLFHSSHWQVRSDWRLSRLRLFALSSFRTFLFSIIAVSNTSDIVITSPVNVNDKHNINIIASIDYRVNSQ